MNTASEVEQIVAQWNIEIPSLVVFRFAEAAFASLVPEPATAKEIKTLSDMVVNERRDAFDPDRIKALADWALYDFIPATVEGFGYKDEAEKLRNLPKGLMFNQIERAIKHSMTVLDLSIPDSYDKYYLIGALDTVVSSVRELRQSYFFASRIGNSFAIVNAVMERQELSTTKLRACGVRGLKAICLTQVKGK